MGSIVVATSDKSAADTICSCLPLSEEIRRETKNWQSACEVRPRAELLFVDIGLFLGDRINLGSVDWKEDVNSFKGLFPGMQCVVLSNAEQLRKSLNLVKNGLDDYLVYPIDSEEIKVVTQNLLDARRKELELDYLRNQFWKDESLESVRTRSRVMSRVYEKVRAVASTRTTVLITGETGTGKGVVARLIHRHSNRLKKQFIELHCGAIPETLVESELFGHEKGAFTGAHRRKLGKFEIADRGTIFLDEISTIGKTVQIKLLQVLQDGTLSRVGSEETIQTNVRVIAATNQSLKELSDEGIFRSDLFYRLNVFPIDLPALRERSEDIPLLVDTFLKKMNGLYGKEIHEIDPAALEVLSAYPWPGNIRELENLIERAYILESSDCITLESFPSELISQKPHSASMPVSLSVKLAEARKQAVERFERLYLKELLTVQQGKIAATAQAAGITTRQLNKLMSKHGIRKEEFKKRG